MQKAFDSVWHDGLLYKLREVPKCYLHESRTFCVRVDNHVSYEMGVACAEVPQGNVLSLVQFSVYVKDVFRDPRHQTFVFADYTTAYTSDRNADRALLSSIPPPFSYLYLLVYAS